MACDRPQLGQSLTWLPIGGWAAVVVIIGGCHVAAAVVGVGCGAGSSGYHVGVWRRERGCIVSRRRRLRHRRRRVVVPLPAPVTYASPCLSAGGASTAAATGLLYSLLYGGLRNAELYCHALPATRRWHVHHRGVGLAWRRGCAVRHPSRGGRLRTVVADVDGLPRVASRHHRLHAGHHVFMSAIWPFMVASSV